MTHVLPELGVDTSETDVTRYVAMRQEQEANAQINRELSALKRAFCGRSRRSSMRPTRRPLPRRIGGLHPSRQATVHEQPRCF